ncbi:hypothetical protein BX600DRAFT_119205 [Xylariales sp. PMI_506]|nr:hypothetical protein BX600DRAFT_119205 [Xylariales sp. PMI_506]
MIIPRWIVPAQATLRRVKWAQCFICSACALAALLLLRRVATNKSTAGLAFVSHKPPPIPNIVHFVMMKRDEHSELNFSFASFLSVYSALQVLQPSRVYIHTDYNKTMIARARVSESRWTRLLLTRFPEVTVNQVPSVTHANGREIKHVEHRSDMVRFGQVYDKGGLYMDFDVYALRDARALREAGFSSIVGRQQGGTINNGCFMAQQGSALAFLMQRDQWSAFTGGWRAHSVNLLTSIAERLVRSPGEVLILDQLAMAPVGWEEKDIARMYAPHHGASVPHFPQVNDDAEDPIARWDDRVRSEDWEMDFSATYFLHAFRRDHADIPGFRGVSVKYITERNSNFALATWNIVQMGIQEGIFSETDDEI